MKTKFERRLQIFPKTLALPARVFILTVFFTGCLAVLWSAWRISQTIDHHGILIIVLALISTWFAIRIPILSSQFQSLSVTLSDIFIFVAIFSGRLEVAIVAAALEGLGSSLRVRVRQLHKWIFNIGLLSTSALVSGWTFSIFSTGPLPTLLIIVAALAAVCLYFAVNTLLVSAAVSLSLNQPLWPVWTKHFLWAAPSSAANGTSALCLILVSSSVQGVFEFAMIPMLLVIFSASRIHQRFQKKAISGS